MSEASKKGFVSELSEVSAKDYAVAAGHASSRPLAEALYRRFRVSATQATIQRPTSINCPLAVTPRVAA